MHTKRQKRQVTGRMTFSTMYLMQWYHYYYETFVNVQVLFNFNHTYFKYDQRRKICSIKL